MFNPEMEIVKFAIADVITTSNDEGLGENDTDIL